MIAVLDTLVSRLSDRVRPADGPEAAPPGFPEALQAQVRSEPPPSDSDPSVSDGAAEQDESDGPTGDGMAVAFPVLVAPPVITAPTAGDGDGPDGDTPSSSDGTAVRLTGDPLALSGEAGTPGAPDPDGPGAADAAVALAPDDADPTALSSNPAGVRPDRPAEALPPGATLADEPAQGTVPVPATGPDGEIPLLPPAPDPSAESTATPSADGPQPPGTETAPRDAVREVTDRATRPTPAHAADTDGADTSDAEPAPPTAPRHADVGDLPGFLTERAD